MQMVKSCQMNCESIVNKVNKSRYQSIISWMINVEKSFAINVFFFLIVKLRLTGAKTTGDETPFNMNDMTFKTVQNH